MMASQPIEGSAVLAFPATPPMPAVSRILGRYRRDQLATFIAVAIDLLDCLDGDADREDNNDREATDGDDQGDQAWVEWGTLPGPKKRGPNYLAGEEDDEIDDPPEDDDSDHCLAGEDWMIGGPVVLSDFAGFSSRPSLYNVGMDEDMEIAPIPA